MSSYKIQIFGCNRQIPEREHTGYRTIERAELDAERYRKLARQQGWADKTIRVTIDK